MVGRIFFLRKPPAVLGVNNPGIDTRENLDPLPTLAPFGFNGDPVTGLDTESGCRIGMQFTLRFRLSFPQPWYLPVL